MKKHIMIMAVFFVITAFTIGCGAKSPMMQDGKQITVFVLLDRGIKDSMTENERNDRNEVAPFMEQNLVDMLNREGYNATPIQNRNQYVQGSANYLITVNIPMLRLVGRAARAWLGYAASPTILHVHYEVSGPNNAPMLSYDDEDSTMRDWTHSPREVNQRLVQKLKDHLVGKLK
jgi:hypothetical protein